MGTLFRGSQTVRRSLRDLADGTYTASATNDFDLDWQAAHGTYNPDACVGEPPSSFSITTYTLVIDSVPPSSGEVLSALGGPRADLSVAATDDRSGIRDYAWSFGDGLSEVETSGRASHVYAVGTWHGTVDITDRAGNATRRAFVVEVKPQTQGGGGGTPGPPATPPAPPPAPPPPEVPTPAASPVLPRRLGLQVRVGSATLSTGGRLWVKARCSGGACWIGTVTRLAVGRKRLAPVRSRRVLLREPARWYRVDLNPPPGHVRSLRRALMARTRATATIELVASRTDNATPPVTRQVRFTIK